MDRPVNRKSLITTCSVALVASLGYAGGLNTPEYASQDQSLHGQVPISMRLSDTAAFAAREGVNTELLPLTFNPVRLGRITPNGWLWNELELEANGLAGHERDFLDWVSDSSWTGGSSEYSDLNEGLPYWYNGIVPLAYSLNDERLKRQASEVTKSVLSRQTDDGWIGPETGTTYRNFWGRVPFFLGLTNLVDVDPDTWSEPVLAAFKKFVPLMHSMLANNGTGFLYHEGDGLAKGDTQWGRVRAQDMLISLMWMYEKHPQGQEDMLLDSMQMFYNMSLNWDAWYNEAVYIKDDLYNVPEEISNSNFPYLHGVNVGQGLKAPAVTRRLTHNSSSIQTAKDGVTWTFQYHGSASGSILADEREDGLNPYSGSELCTAVEIMYSLSYLYQAIGDPTYADIAEKTTFNALPAMMTGDWWAHQYMAQPNQPYSINLSTTPFFNTGSWSQTFGLEPNYPCCAVNHPQGLPKFLMATYVTTDVPDVGVAHALLSPASIKIEIPGTKTDVTIDCETSYPFENTLNYTIRASNDFNFFLRVPSWAGSDSTIAINGGEAISLSPDGAALHKLRMPEGTSSVTYKLKSEIRTEKRANQTVAVFNGALMYALEIGSRNSSSPPRGGNSGTPPPQAVDYQIKNTTAWNYAIDTSTLKAHMDEDFSNPGFAPRAPPNSITAKACKIDWPLYKGSVPGSAPTGKAKKCVERPEQVKLVPYGSAKIRMGELPTMNLTLER